MFYIYPYVFDTRNDLRRHPDTVRTESTMRKGSGTYAGRIAPSVEHGYVDGRSCRYEVARSALAALQHFRIRLCVSRAYARIN
mgnify:CR=1 FL=1